MDGGVFFLDGDLKELFWGLVGIIELGVSRTIDSLFSAELSGKLLETV